MGAPPPTPFAARERERCVVNMYARACISVNIVINLLVAPRWLVRRNGFFTAVLMDRNFRVCQNKPEFHTSTPTPPSKQAI